MIATTGGCISRAFWIKRFLALTALVFAVLMLVELLKGHDLETALTFSAVWSPVASGTFTAARIYQSRNPHRSRRGVTPPVSIQYAHGEALLLLPLRDLHAPSTALESG